MLDKVLRNFSGVIVFMVIVCGCGQITQSKPTAKLAGVVTIDGNPLPEDAEGTVQFMPTAGGQAPPTSAPIVSGRYQAEYVPIGPVKASFNITRFTGKMIKESGAPGGLRKRWG